MAQLAIIVPTKTQYGKKYQSLTANVNNVFGKKIKIRRLFAVCFFDDSRSYFSIYQTFYLEKEYGIQYDGRC